MFTFAYRIVVGLLLKQILGFSSPHRLDLPPNPVHLPNMIRVNLYERDKPFVDICSLLEFHTNPKKRELGLMKGSCSVGPEFFQADVEIQRDFEAAQIFPEAKT